VRVFERALDVDHGKYEQDECLQYLSEKEEEVERHRAEEDGDGKAGSEAEEDDERHFLAEDVAEETEGHGEGAGEVGDDFNGEHQRDQRLGRTGEVADVAESPGADADIVVIEEDAEGDGDRGVQVGRRSIASGDEAQKVHRKDVDEDADEQGDEAAAFLAYVRDDEVLKLPHEGLEEVLKPAGNVADVLPNHDADDDEDRHSEPGVEDIVGVDRNAAYVEMLHVEYIRKKKRMCET